MIYLLTGSNGLFFLNNWRKLLQRLLCSAGVNSVHCLELDLIWESTE